jgi:hypothetical protein
LTALYNRLGRTYVGAGTGAYEPTDCDVVAVDPRR